MQNIKLKKYKDFLKTFENSSDSLESDEYSNLKKEFIEDFIKSSKSIGLNISFSHIAKNSYSTDTEEFIEEDIIQFERKYGKEFLIDVTTKHLDEIYSELEKAHTPKKYQSSDHTGENVYVDIFLHNYNKRVVLGGYSIKDDIDTIIRYLYGWHDSKYGKIAIEEEFGSIDNYYKYIRDNMKNVSEEYLYDIEDSFDSIIIAGNNIVNDYRRDNIEEDFYVLEGINLHLIVFLQLISEEDKKDIEKYIIESLIKHDKKKYFSMFTDLDISNIDDDFIKKLNKAGNNTKNFNL